GAQPRRTVAVVEGGRTVGDVPADRGGRVGDERVEAVLVALRVTRGQARVAGGGRRERLRVAHEEARSVPPALPQQLGLLLVERQGRLRARDLEEQAVLASRRHLRD